jgi:hypothetical protein
VEAFLSEAEAEPALKVQSQVMEAHAEKEVHIAAAAGFAIEGQESTSQLLGKHHELSIVAGAPRLDRQLQNPSAINGFLLRPSGGHAETQIATAAAGGSRGLAETGQ